MTDVEDTRAHYGEEIALALADVYSGETFADPTFERGTLAILDRVVAPLVEQLRQARAELAEVKRVGMRGVAKAARERDEARAEVEQLRAGWREADQFNAGVVQGQYAELAALRARLARSVELPADWQQVAVDAAAERVHEAWMAGKLAAGITSRLAEDGEELMVSWSDLSERQKDMDRASARATVDAFAALIESWRGVATQPAQPARPELTDEQKTAVVAALESGNYLACDGEYVANLPDCEPQLDLSGARETPISRAIGEIISGMGGARDGHVGTWAESVNVEDVVTALKDLALVKAKRDRVEESLRFARQRLYSLRDTVLRAVNEAAEAHP